ncbi:LppU/SCO3897 family protein [Micromonospora sp. DT233]|uniref:LppU/SCO3897 family protein n=1 Tax=Micromonospora sp. DT233 TaxID=3393432 RepID=UPI003CEAD2E5
MDKQVSTLDPAETETAIGGSAETGTASPADAPTTGDADGDRRGGGADDGAAGSAPDGDSDPDDTADPDGGDPEAGGWSPLARMLTVLGGVAVLVGALVVLGLRYDVAGRLLTPDRTASAAVGDCLGRLPDVADSGQRRAATAQVVDCSSPEAAYDVVGRLDGQSEQQARDGRQCEPFVARGGAYYTYSSVPADGTGYLLCLAPRG